MMPREATLHIIVVICNVMMTASSRIVVAVPHVIQDHSLPRMDMAISQMVYMMMVWFQLFITMFVFFVHACRIEQCCLGP